jgi:uncharacterized membrane protein
MNAHPDTDVRVWFDADVRPNRSLTGQGLKRLALAMLALATVMCTGLVLFGQWIAAGFLILDFGLLGVAFLANTRSLRATERVRIEDDALVVERRQPGRPPERRILSAGWARVLRMPHRQTTGLEAVAICVGQEKVFVGAALAPWERPHFADALEAALIRRKTGLCMQ